MSRHHWMHLSLGPFELPILRFRKCKIHVFLQYLCKGSQICFLRTQKYLDFDSEVFAKIRFTGFHKL